MFSVQLRFPDATIFQFSSSTFRRQPHLASISSHVSLSSSSSWRRATASDAHTETYESLERRWDSLGFNPVKTDYVYVMKSSEDGSFSNGSLRHAERRCIFLNFNIMLRVFRENLKESYDFAMFIRCSIGLLQGGVWREWICGVSAALLCPSKYTDGSYRR
ncbi:branched-chain-amino-acid aminotransferase 5, chloroplastic-like [Hibiscus syriacus]|uniref:branched-chain-amino-acid aminotransferase 5, chloroplastic-like n=1 Tax=Hibiscus syriacus TaxID=106335 RepID=UPI00192383CA|nr:branched-chain-amino-acid aminotransferase 5, chloroplastic-like [Hibiscus syriacus]